MSDELELELEITGKGLNAPRLRPEDIDATIVDEDYIVLPSGKTMICELTLENGFTVRGEASMVSKDNFNYDIGKKISRQKARDKIWELEAYLLQERICNA